MEETKPVPQVGQRWKHLDANRGQPFTITGRHLKGGREVGWDRDGGFRNGGDWLSNEAFESPRATYLGTISPQGEPGVEAGQRRRWNPGKEGINGTDFTLHAYNDGFFARHDNGQDGCAMAAEYWEAHSTLLLDPPATTTGAPQQVTPATSEQAATVPRSRGALPAPSKREVSHNGRDWTDYDRLTDSDAWEAYRHRRLDGVVVAAVVEASRVRIVGRYGMAPDEVFSVRAKPRSGLVDWRKPHKPEPWRPSVDETDLLCGDVL
jgi:hypothetical protein